MVKHKSNQKTMQSIKISFFKPSTLDAARPTGRSRCVRKTAGDNSYLYIFKNSFPGLTLPRPAFPSVPFSHSPLSNFLHSSLYLCSFSASLGEQMQVFVCFLGLM